MQNELVEKVGRIEKRMGTIALPAEDVTQLVKSVCEADLLKARQITGKEERNQAMAAIRDRLLEEHFAIPDRRSLLRARCRRAATAGGEGGVSSTREEGHSEADRRVGDSGGRSRPHRDSSAAVGSGHLRSHARLRSLPAGRDAVGRHLYAGHEPRRADRRRSDARVRQEVLPPLQLPALLRRRGGPDHGTGSARDRARCLGRAIASGDPPQSRGVPVHRARGQRHHRVQRLFVDGIGVWRLSRPDGRRRSDQGDVCGNLGRPLHGGGRIGDSRDRHHRRRGLLRRDGLQGLGNP